MNQPDHGVASTGVPRVFLIADDLTGAADSGVTFAKQGARVIVSWAPVLEDAGDESPGGVQDVDVIAYTTESRHCTPEAAMQRVSTAMASLFPIERRRAPMWLYKKIDSTLRGHPGAELAALMSAPVGDAQSVERRVLSQALVAPALPSQGRVTRGGIHYVHGVPLSETVFGPEVGTSDVGAVIGSAFPKDSVERLPLAMLRRGGDAPLSLLTGSQAGFQRSSSPRVVIADAETETDLGDLIDVAFAGDMRLLCGSAGLAEALAERLARLGAWCSPESMQTTFPRSGAGVLVVAGSRNPQTLLQIDKLADAGVPVVCPAVAWFQDTATGVEPVVTELASALADGAAVLSTGGLPPLPVPGRQLVARLAEVVVALLASRSLAGMILTGGDAAIAVGQALGAVALRLRGEIERGVPWGHLVGGEWDGLPVVTKAGGFGTELTLLSAVEFLSATSKG